MLNNYYTLLHLADSFKSLIGTKVIEIFSQEKDSVVLCFYDGLNLKYLYFSASTTLPTIYIDNNFKRKSHNTINLMHELLGDYLQNVSIVENDRIIAFNFIKYDLYFHIFSGVASNVYFCDKNKNIIFYFKNHLNKETSKYIYSTPQLMNFTEFIGTESVLKALTKSEFLLTKHYAEEILLRTGLISKSTLNELTNEQFLSILKKAENLIIELKTSKKYYIFKTDNEPILSLIKLQKYPIKLYEFDDISQAVKKCKSSIIKYKLEIDLRNQIYKTLSEKLEKYHEKISEIENLSNKKEIAHTYSLMGDLLLSQSNLKTKGLSSITLENYDGEKLLVKLDPELTILENSQKYYNKSKKIIKSIDNQVFIIDKLKNKIEMINQLLIEFINILYYKDLKHFYNKLINLKIIVLSNNNKNNLQNNFKQFDLGGNFTLYVGKNAKNNDELTFKFAKPNDIWLHARGIAGSHAIIPLNKNQNVPKSVIEKAASIVAYYSAARKSSYVPVIFTYKKYLRKPKGAAPGEVIVTKENVAFVEPKLTENM
jgi:predicted ribosome quality control (RQC) complex YloA/Tae2 family protein